eukprot:1197722-Pyramimonas_sp.AAC.1
MEGMRRDGVDLPNANSTPPWEYVPDANPSPNHPSRHGCVPAFFSHPASGPTAANRPVAPRMDSAIFPRYYAQTTGVPRAGSQPENPCVRATADDYLTAKTD